MREATKQMLAEQVRYRADLVTYDESVRAYARGLH